jgi:lysophospholipase L1-like esterase
MGIAAALLLTMVLTPTPVAPEYVALGDSYAAGVGAGDYDAGSGQCRRSRNAYPELRQAAHGYASFRFVACSGATTQDVLDSQVDDLTAETGLVTLTVGGNDIGFADVMTTCTLSSDRSCVAAVDRARQVITNEVPGRLDEVFARIKTAAPDAKVVVLGYPHLFEQRNCLGGLTDAKRNAINAGADQLADVTAARTAEAGATFVDMRTAFAGHGICGEEPWLHALTNPTGDSYHPNKAGQAAYAAALDQAGTVAKAA